VAPFLHLSPTKKSSQNLEGISKKKKDYKFILMKGPKICQICCKSLFSKITMSVKRRCHDIQHEDTQHNDSQHEDTQHNDIQHNNK
jgi:hypothetical protein